MAPVASTITEMNVNIATTPAATKTRTYTLRVDTKDTALACTISAGETTCSDTGSIDVEVGEEITMIQTTTNSPAAVLTYASLTINTLSENSSFYCGRNTDLFSGADYYLTFAGERDIASQSHILNFMIVPTSGTFKNLYVDAENDPGAFRTRTYTVHYYDYSGASYQDSSITCTMTGLGDDECTDLSNTLHVDAGDQISLHATYAGSRPPQTGDITHSIQFDADRDGEYIIPVGMYTRTDPDDVDYILASGAEKPPTDAEETHQQLIHPRGEIKKMYTWYAGAGDCTIWYTTLRYNGSDTGFSTTSGVSYPVLKVDTDSEFLVAAFDEINYKISGDLCSEGDGLRGFNSLLVEVPSRRIW